MPSPPPDPPAACHSSGAKGSGGDLADQARLGIVARVGGVQPFLVGEQHQQVGLDQVGDQRGQVVVVAKADFLGRHGVVFVDDRDHALVEQGFERVARVEIAAAVGQIGAGEQHLGHARAVDGEILLVDGHQARLADGGQHLLGGQMLGQGGEAQRLAPGGDRPRRNQHHLADPRLARRSPGAPGRPAAGADRFFSPPVRVEVPSLITICSAVGMDTSILP